jgi:hypothetical protein
MIASFDDGLMRTVRGKSDLEDSDLAPRVTLKIIVGTHVCTLDVILAPVLASLSMEASQTYRAAVRSQKHVLLACVHNRQDKVLPHIEASPLDLSVAKDKQGRTSLAFAAWFGNLELCNILVAGGASLLQTDFEGNMPFSFAMYRGHVYCAKFLLESTIMEDSKRREKADNGGSKIEFWAHY